MSGGGTNPPSSEWSRDEVREMKPDPEQRLPPKDRLSLSLLLLFLLSRRGLGWGGDKGILVSWGGFRPGKTLLSPQVSPPSGRRRRRRQERLRHVPELREHLGGSELGLLADGEWEGCWE